MFYFFVCIVSDFVFRKWRGIVILMGDDIRGSEDHERLPIPREVFRRCRIRSFVLELVLQRVM